MPEDKTTEASSNRPSRINMDTFVKLIQLSAILAAGIWTIYTYVTYQRGQQQLSLQQQQVSKEQDELTLEQSKLLANTRRETEETSLKQQEFDLGQKKLLADTQKTAAETSVIQQKSTLEQQRFTYQQQKLVSDSEANKSKYDALIKGFAVDAEKQLSIEYDINATLKKTREADGAGGIGEYKLKIDLTAKNLADREVSVTAAFVQIFLGDTHKTVDGQGVAQLNMPLEDSNIGSDDDSGIKWTEVILKKFGSHGVLKADSECMKVHEPYSYKGLAFGALKRKEKNSYRLEFTIRAQQHRFVGYRIHMTKDACTEEEWDYEKSDFFALSAG